ncbi:MAG: Ig-like domain-containing protein, partial [archaeon]
MDKEVQAMKQGFLKTAAFFSLNSASKELATYGGHAEASLIDVDNDDVADSTVSEEPKILLGNEFLFLSRIPFWTVPNCENTLKRVPYLKDTDVNTMLGDRFIMLFLNNEAHRQYIDEINADKYPLYITIQILMLKKGQVTVSCLGSEGCLSLAPVGTTPPTITKDGIYTYKLTRIKADEFATSIHITAKNETGDIDGVAMVKQITASIYNPAVITTPNALLRQYLNEYHASMATVLADRNADADIRIDIAPLNCSMTRGNNDNTQAIVWPDEAQGAITATVKDIMDPTKNLAEIRDSGLITEEVKIRYYKLYSYAERFTDTSQTLLQSRLWDMLYNLDMNAHSGPSGENCGYPTCTDPAWCPDDQVKSYTSAEIYTSIIAALNQLASDYDDLTATEGVTWQIQYLLSYYTIHDTTNVNKGACDTAEHIESEKFEYIEYIKATYADVGDCTCEPDSGGCGHTNYADVNRCTMDYDRRYILKNLKFLVTITDDRNKIYNPEANNWQKLKFRFYVTVPIVDMNCCGPPGATHFCDTHGSSCNNPYGTIPPSLALSGPFEITSGPTASISGTSVTIQWTTNRLSDSTLKYSTTAGGPYTDITDPTELLAHSIGIGGLIAEQDYYIIVESSDGTETVTSSEYTFIAGIDTSDPFINITSPLDGETVDNPVTLTVDARHSSGIVSVEFFVFDSDTGTYGPPIASPGSSSPYTGAITVTDTGMYRIKAVATPNTGNPAEATVNLMITDMPNIVGSVTIEPGTNDAKITFDTDVPTTGVIRYGKTIMYGDSEPISILAAHHELTIIGLDPATDYYYQIELTNPQSISSIALSDTFKTL